ncbi:nitroreductase [Actinophytocola sp.]|uniref:Acg family FMN-binding oxidoreductase n=1 Tax=Actinophytocola sp. TaxID=1872138 RepID=UPI0025C1078A|nr:nitroreductase [Actinophytocola sp.]
MLQVVDPDGKEARIACGAALFNIRAALRSARLTTTTELKPATENPDLQATVRVTGQPYEPTAEDLLLAAAVEFRHTNRYTFTDRPVSDEIRNELVYAAREEGGQLVTLDEPAQLDALAGLVSGADEAQRRNAGFRTELARWTTRLGERDEGVPIEVGGPRPSTDGLFAVGPLRTNGDAGRTRRPLPLVGVLTTHTNSDEDLLRAGQALQCVLLTATSWDVRAAFLSQPVEVAETGRALRNLVAATGQPQVVLRFGYSSVALPTPRRPVSAVSRYL